jgi:hypothetical protein
MSRAAPPGNERPSTRPSNRGHKSKKLSGYYLRGQVFATHLYISILAERRANNLLAPFHCSCCGALDLDPCGRNEKQEWLCGRCA